jgi:hypothetical protein
MRESVGTSVEVSKMRKRKKLLRVVVAAALLVVAVPSAAAAYNLEGGGQASARTEKARCSLDPRLLRLEPELCSDNRVTTVPGTTTFDQAPASSDSAVIEPASSDDTENVIGWWMVGIAVAAGGVAGLIFGLRRGRPEALS